MKVERIFRSSWQFAAIAAAIVLTTFAVANAPDDTVVATTAANEGEFLGPEIPNLNDPYI